MKTKRYTSDAATVTYQPARCIHFAACVRGLPDVFDPDARPWIQPDACDTTDALEEVVLRCPTGALHIERHDRGAGETPPEANTVTVAPDGPLYVHGDVTVQTPDGAVVVSDTRIALCRCGASQHKPYCDGSHTAAGFADPAASAPNDQLGGAASDVSTPLIVTLAADGPLLCAGPLRLVYATEDAQTTPSTGTKAALCRCGASSNKPYCDGSHKAAGFSSDGA